MTTAPVPNSRTPLLAVQNTSQPSGSQRRQSRTASPGRPSNVPNNISFIRSSRRKRSPRPSVFPILVTCVLLICASVIVWDISSYGNCYFKSLCNALGAGERVDRIWWENAGAYAPWRSVGSGGGKRGLPRGCEINQVTLLHRHGARYPTASAGQKMQAVLDKLANRAIAVPKRRAELAFIDKADLHMKGWKFDHLLDQGRKASWRSGRELKALYQNLIEEGEGLFTRASGSDRVVETAGYWLEGFNDQPFKVKNSSKLPVPNVIVPEDDTSNNTLSVHNCPAFENQSDQDLSGILGLLVPARDRLNRLLQPSPSFTVEDVLPLADMCPYDSQVNGEDWEAWSRWCGIFSREEWEVIGHWRDASRYYEVGQGSPYGGTMGAGWANELIARLTDSEVEDHTSTNRTLDADERTFPRGGKRFFVDFGHDNEMIEALAAMGVLKQKRDLPVASVPDKRTFMTSEIIPFGSRIIFERIGCDLGEWEPDPEAPEGRKGDGRKNYIRIFVNDKLVPIHHVLCSQSGFVEHKMCEVDSFLDTQSWAREEVDWDNCFLDPETQGSI